jgi:site-specific recombinase XerD
MPHSVPVEIPNAEITLWIDQSPIPKRDELLTAFADFIDLTVANGNPTEDTRTGYKKALRPFIEWCWDEKVTPAVVTPDQVKLYRAHLRDKGRAASTIALYLTAVRRFYDAATERGLIATNPATGIKGGSDRTAPEDKIKALSNAALQSLADWLPAATLAEKRDRLCVALMAWHGLRRVEVHRLDHEFLNVDSDGGVLLVPGKGNKTRRVFLLTDTLECWQEYETSKERAGFPTQGALVIALDNSSRGKRMSRTSLNTAIDRALNMTGLKRNGVSCHALRHTYGTLAVAGGAKVEHLRDAMGHSKLETTGTYVRAVEKRRNNPALCIEARLTRKSV